MTPMEEAAREETLEHERRYRERKRGRRTSADQTSTKHGLSAQHPTIGDIRGESICDTPISTMFSVDEYITSKRLRERLCVCAKSPNAVICIQQWKTVSTYVKKRFLQLPTSYDFGTFMNGFCRRGLAI
ncbi:hypothetical protein TNCV_4672531 [Trichonephila clavipes]|nr:hypothetical protein TNCV_4672531 [Trichonephila clavipes]